MKTPFEMSSRHRDLHIVELATMSMLLTLAPGLAYMPWGLLGALLVFIIQLLMIATVVAFTRALMDL